MFKFIKNACVLILLFKITIAQIYLHSLNLNQVCNCVSSQSIDMRLSEKKISLISPFTFYGLNSLQKLYLERNRITSIDPSTFNGLKILYRKLLGTIRNFLFLSSFFT